MTAPLGARQGMALLVWSASLQHSERCATLWMSAQALAAMDLSVEMYFTGPSVELLRADRQASILGYGDQALPLSHHLDQTVKAGVSLWACSQALQALQIEASALVPACGRGGLVQFAARCAEPGWGSLVF